MTGEENQEEDREPAALFSLGAGVQGWAVLRTCKGDIVWVCEVLTLASIAFSRNPGEYGFLPGSDIVLDSGACFRNQTHSIFTVTRRQAGSKKPLKQP